MFNNAMLSGFELYSRWVPLHEGMICKNLSIFLYLYADFVIE